MEILIEEAHMFQMMYYMYPLVSCFTSLHFSFLQGSSIKKNPPKKEVMLFLCINLKTFWWDFVVASLQFFGSSWRGVDQDPNPDQNLFSLRELNLISIYCLAVWLRDNSSG